MCLMTGSSEHSAPQLSHVDESGAARMVDVGGKPVTARRAVASGTVITTPEVMDLIASGNLPKGEALPIARVAGIMGAKRTWELIPLCHPLDLSGIDVTFSLERDRVHIQAEVKTSGKTGVEMEALTAVSLTALTIYDMIKAVDKHAVLTDIKVDAKSGGKSGDWTREPGNHLGDGAVNHLGDGHPFPPKDSHD